jgi:hypothetical protein
LKNREQQQWANHRVDFWTNCSREQVAPGRERLQLDFGAGLRVKLTGAAGVLRVDIAHGISDGANALTFGWLFASRMD